MHCRIKLIPVITLLADFNLFHYIAVDGYGKSIYFWSLVSALGTFWFGAGISSWNSIKDILDPSLSLHSIGWEVWTVLGVSFTIDGYVLAKVMVLLCLCIYGWIDVSLYM